MIVLCFILHDSFMLDFFLPGLLDFTVSTASLSEAASVADLGGSNAYPNENCEG